VNRELLLLLINKVLSNTSTPEEEELLFNYYQSFQKIDNVEWDEANLDSKDLLKEKMLKRLLLSLNPQADSNKPNPILAYFRPLTSVAAILLFIVASLYFLRDNISNLFNPIQINTIITASKETRRVQLPDSSIIWLEPETTLTYPSAFKSDTREISLLGGAFFEVTKNPKRPFIIHTKNVTTKVLGTSFNEEAYSSSKISVTVVTGKVVVTSNSNELQTSNKREVILYPQQQVVYDSATNRFEKLGAPNAVDFIERRNGKFIYKGEKLLKVINDIERIYDVNIDINPNAAINNCTFYGTFDIHSDVSTILKIISISLNTKIVKNMKSGHYIIAGGRCF